MYYKTFEINYLSWPEIADMRQIAEASDALPPS